MRLWVLLVVLFQTAGCCWMAKRDCFPACPPPKLVDVIKPCELPGPVQLEPFRRAECPGKPDMICYTAPEAAKLASNLDALKVWIIQARVRCGSGVAPTSRPGPSSAPARP